MKVTAVVDCYNSSEYLEETIASVLAQSRLPDEIVLVDDGSTDHTYDLALELLADVPYARVVRKENGGQMSCVTAGMMEATGDVFAFLDGDDLWEPNHLELAVREFESNPKLGLYYCAYKIFGNSDQLWTPRYGEGTLTQTWALVMCGHTYIEGVNSGIVVRREALLQFLPLPVDIELDWTVNADNIVVWLTSMSGMQKFGSNTPTIRFRDHADNNSKKQAALDAVAFRKVTEQRFFNYMEKQLNLEKGAALCLADEYLAQPRKTKYLKRDYLKALKTCRSELSFSQWWKIFKKLRSA